MDAPTAEVFGAGTNGARDRLASGEKRIEELIYIARECYFGLSTS
jgi:hypothetical protein